VRPPVERRPSRRTPRRLAAWQAAVPVLAHQHQEEALQCGEHCGRDALWAHDTLMTWRDRSDVVVLDQGRFAATDRLRSLQAVGIR
jgi:hypothetical protein